METELSAAVGFVVAAAATFVATPVAIGAARRLQFYDRPHGYHQHAAPTPLLGGTAVLVGLLLGAIAVGVSGRLLVLLGCALALWLLGTLDDWIPVAPLWRVLADTAPRLREIAREMHLIVDHYGMVDASSGVNEPNFQALLKLVGEGHAYVKVSAPYRVSRQYPDYADARALHEALLRANPERLIWGTDWPHPSIPAAVMPDDGHLLDLFCDWTSNTQTRRRILVDTPALLFGG